MKQAQTSIVQRSTSTVSTSTTMPPNSLPSAAIPNLASELTPLPSPKPATTTSLSPETSNPVTHLSTPQRWLEAQKPLLLFPQLLLLLLPPVQLLPQLLLPVQLLLPAEPQLLLPLMAQQHGKSRRLSKKPPVQTSPMPKYI